jgi:hypothetical protein
LNELKTLGIDMKSLFSSSIFFHKIDFRLTNVYKELSPDLKYCIVYSNKNSLIGVYMENLDFEREKIEENRQPQNIEYYVVNIKDQIGYEETEEDRKKLKA